MWGQGFMNGGENKSDGIIPMRVGTSKHARHCVECFQDHPHACRECYRFFRIIPMRVGTRFSLDRDVIIKQDHPHACGDKPLYRFALKMSRGSSPCVWGQEFDFCAFRLSGRIIPMRVGTRSISTLYLSLLKDHPHACGDKFITSLGFLLSTGSSPCVWGQVMK